MNDKIKSVPSVSVTYAHNGASTKANVNRPGNRGGWLV